MKINEMGRSMVEMLGALAVIGILSITAVMGFRYGMNKLKANRIYNDAKLAYVSISSSGGAPYHWAAPEFTPECGYTLSVRRDKDNNNFVLVDGVEDEVCDLLLDMAEDGGEVSLYYLDNQPMTCEEDEQDIVISFAGMEPLIPCDGGGVLDCPDDAQAYCDAERQVCQTCPLGEWANDAGDGCEAVCSGRSDEYTETCVSESQMAEWCCKETQMCSDVVGECISENACSYDLKTFGYTTDCSATLNVFGYTTNCSGILTITTDVDGSQRATMTDTGCTDNEYCVYAWSQSSWDTNDTEPKLSNTETTNFYGQCRNYRSPVDIVPISMATVTTTGCKSNEYCVVAWTADHWEESQPEPTLPDNHTQTMYGQCRNYRSPADIVPISMATLSEQKPCQKGQYCVLLWSDSNCNNALTNKHLDRFYGVCAEWDKTSTTCPVNETGKEVK